MALRNPYSEYSRTGDEDGYRREALLRELEEPEAPQPITARPRTPVRTPQETRTMLDGPGGRTQAVDQPDVSNAFTGDRWQDERPGEDAYQPPSTSATTTPGQTGAQPRGADAFQSNMTRGYQLMDEYDDAYTRRNEGPGGALSNAAKYAQTGASVGSVVPGVGTLVGGIVGGIGGLIGGAFTKNAKSAATDFAIEDARQIISQAHEDAFGRPITPEYLDQIIRGQGWEDGDRWMGEKQLAYVLDAFAQQAPGARAAQAAANAAAAQQGAQQTTPAGATGALGDYAGNLEGFAMERFADPSGRGNNTVKYQVGRVLSRHPPTAEGLAAAAEELRGMGIDVTQGGRNGDLLEFGAGVVDDNGNAIGTVDVGRGFGAAGSGWAWQPGGATGGGGGDMGDAPADIQGAYAYLKSIAHPGMSRAEMESAVTRAFGNVPGFEKAYAGDVVINGRKIDLITNFEGPGASWSDNLSFVPLQGGGAAVPTGGGTNGLSLANLAPGVQLAAPLGQSDVNKAIQEALQRIISGAPDRDALLAELGVA